MNHLGYILAEDLDLLGYGEPEESYYSEGVEDYTFEVPQGYELEEFDDSTELAEALSEVLHTDYGHAAAEEMQEALFNMFDMMTPAEEFNFKNVVRQISKAGEKAFQDPTVGQIAKTVLPAAGSTIGTIYGGPVGTAVGGKLGQAAAQAFNGRGKPTPTPTAVNVAGIAGGVAVPAKPSAKEGSAAAARLLQLTQNPDVLRGLMALALGSHGRQSIEIGQDGPTVSVGAIMNLLQTAVNQATADAEELVGESGEASTYLTDSEGNFRVDSAVPEDRAEVLYNVLSEVENQRLAEDFGSYPGNLELVEHFDSDELEETLY